MSFEGYIQIIFETIVPACIAIILEAVFSNKKNRKKYVICTIGIWILIAISVSVIYNHTKTNDHIENETEAILSHMDTKTGDQSPVFNNNSNYNTVVYNNYPNESYDGDTETINLNDITLNYAALTDERFKKVFLIEETDDEEYSDFSTLKEKYYIENNCITIVNISNPTDHEIKLNKFRIIAENISPDLQPKITTFLDSGSAVDLEILNEGWVDINNIKIEITDKDKILSQFYNEADLVYEIPQIKVGETKDLHILDKELMIKIPNNSIDDAIIINPIINFTSDEITITKNVEQIHIYNEGIFVGDYGASGACVYGIAINTDQNTFIKEFNINESINSNNILDVPLCFFPDKSCSFDFYVEFDIFDGINIETIKSEIKHLYFDISSVYSKWINIDENIVNLQDEYCDYITYPYKK